MPWVPDDAPACAAGTAPYACDMPRETAITDEAVTARWVARQLDAIPRSGYVDTTPFLCDATRCRAKLYGAQVYLDDLHLNPAVTGTFAPAYRDLFR